MKTILVVGAGFSGSVIARQLAESGLQVLVIDKRSHIGGNAYDYINNNSENIHMYGPHLLHGDKDSMAIKWLSRFTKWVFYEHKVRALLDDSQKTTPLPVNRTTLEDIFDCKLESEMEAKRLLEDITIKCDICTSDDVFMSSVGPVIANKLFRPYTKKMWGLDASKIEAAVGKRLPVRISRDDRYFTDSFQALPSQGYTECFNKILSHKNIEVRTGCQFEMPMIDHYLHSFLCLPIDSFFDYSYGKLPYRSIKFETRLQKIKLPAPVINFTDDGIYTRMTQWSQFPNSNQPKNRDYAVTYEIPCDPKENNDELFYPVRNKDSLKIHRKYQTKASKYKNITFCGRTGLFEYLDMVPAITKHLKIAQSFLKNYS